MADQKRTTTTKAPAKKQSTARTRRGAEARKKNAATPRGATPSRTAETSKRRAQPNARPRNAKKDGVAPGESSDTKGKASYELEASNPTKRPSRKSTRGGANRAKPDSQLKRRQTRAVRSPQARSQSRAG